MTFHSEGIIYYLSFVKSLALAGDISTLRLLIERHHINHMSRHEHWMTSA